MFRRSIQNIGKKGERNKERRITKSIIHSIGAL
jgi:hypothetical protein